MTNEFVLSAEGRKRDVRPFRVDYRVVSESPEKPLSWKQDPGKEGSQEDLTVDYIPVFEAERWSEERLRGHVASLFANYRIETRMTWVEEWSEL